MKILICDDERDSAAQLKSLCLNYLEQAGILHRTQLTCIDDASMIEAEDPDILFLDIEMPGRDGLSAKDALCEKDGKPLIIFVTSHREAMPKAFGRNVVDFISKPATQFRIDVALETAINLLPRDIPIQLEGRDRRRISSADIAYITADKVYTDVHLAAGETVFNQRMSLTVWEELLSDIGFLRISSSCLVNCRYIADFSGERITLEDGLGVLQVSRRRKKACKAAYDAYCKRMARLI